MPEENKVEDEVEVQVEAVEQEPEKLEDFLFSLD